MKKVFVFTILFFLSFSNVYSQTCLPDGITFSTQQQIDDFSINYPDCEKIMGDVIIEPSTPATFIGNLNGLIQLTSIDGSLTIKGSDDLDSFSGLNNLDSIGGDFYLTSLLALINIDGLENLKYVGGNLDIALNYYLENIEGLSTIEEVEGNIRIQFNSFLENLTGLNNITELNALIIQSNNSLTNLSGLNNLNSTTFLSIESNDSLETLDGLESLQEVSERVSINHNDLLLNINGLQNLNSVGGDFNILGNDVLSNFEGLESLNHIEDVLDIQNNISLLEIDALSNLTSVGSILIQFNESLESIEGFIGLNEVAGDFTIQINNKLETLSGLDNLTSVGDKFQIFANQKLENLFNLNSLDSVQGSFQISGSNQLINLEGLSNLAFVGDKFSISNHQFLTSLNGIGGQLAIGNDLAIIGNSSLTDISAVNDMNIDGINFINISYNYILSICDEINICNYLQNGGDSYVENNAGGCSKVDQILQNCEDHFFKVQLDAFYDFNQNQIQDINEVIAPNSSFEINPLGYTFYLNQFNGGKLYLDSGEYSIELNQINFSNWMLTTDSSSYSIMIDSLNTCDTISFGLFPINQSSEFFSFTTGSPARCGEFQIFQPHAINIGTTIAEGTLWLETDPLINPDSVIFITDPDTIVQPNLYGWHFENLYPGYSFSPKISLKIPTPPDVTIGDSLKLKTFVDFIDTNGASTTSTSIYSTEIRCSFDPNDKLVNPSRNNNLTLFEENLIYTIRFQNTGNDEAYDIIVRDTLDENLDPTTFRVLSTSHPSSLITTMEANQFLTFNFENIYLPDSTTNFDASQGYVSYLIHAKEGLAEETSIENTASIYFDFNPPIVTNTTESVMVSELPTSIHNLGGEKGMKIEIYPNPVSTNVFIKKEKTETLEYQIADVNGRLLMSGKLINEINNITFTKMNSGIYFIKITNPKTREYIVDKIVK